MTRYHTTAQGNVPFTQAEEDARDAEEAARAIEAQAEAALQAEEASKLTGIEILGVMCSATRNDQNGLVAVALEYNMKHSAGQTLGDTVFKFENGNTLTITDSNFPSVYATWAPFRQSFFAP